MKKIYLFLTLLLFSIHAAKATNVVIIESESYNSGQVMDQNWLTVCQGLGYTAAIYPQTQLDIDTWFSTTDVLIISSGVINIPQNRVDTIQAFLMQGGRVYIQAEYLNTYDANGAFQSIVNNTGGLFQWDVNTVAGTLAPMNVLGSMGTTPNVVTPLTYFWYGDDNAPGVCMSDIEPFLQYNGAYFGFIYCVPGLSTRMITTSDQDWVNTLTSTPLMQNIVTNLAGLTYTCIAVSGGLSVNLGNDTAVCNGQPVLLDASGSGGTSFIWSTGETTSSITVNTSGTYWVQASNGSCQANDTVVITAGVVSTSTANPSICSGTTYTLPGGSTVSTAGTYMDTIPSSSGCDSIITTNLTVISATLSAGDDTTVCLGQAAQLFANGGTSYSWAPAIGLSNPNIANPAASPLTNTTYYVTITASGCTGVDSVVVTVHNPELTTNSVVICQGTSYTFPDGSTSSVSASDTVVLPDQFGCDSGIITIVTVTPAPTSNVSATICFGSSYTLPSGTVTNTGGVYTDTVITGGGCDSFVVTTLTVTPPPTTNVYDTICQGSTFTLPSGMQVSTSGAYGDTIVTGSGCDSLVIINLTVNPSSASSVNANICQGSSYTLPDGSSVNTAGTYPVTLTNHFGCDSVVTTILTATNLNINVQGNGTLCSGQNNGTINATTTGGSAPYNYVLGLNGNPVGNNSTGNFTNLASGTYTIGVTDNNGCTATASAAVSQNTDLQVAASETDLSCYGVRDGSVSITADGGATGYTYQLDNLSSNSGQFTGLDTGNYTYYVTDGNGCVDSGTISINQPMQMVVNVSPQNDTIELGQGVQLSATSNYDPYATFEWTPDFGLSCYTCATPMVVSNSSAVYKVVARVDHDGVNCAVSTTVSITVIPNYGIFIPNIFTPNGDGKDDYFQIFGNLATVKFLEVDVYDRIGERVFESNDINFKWDGTYKGKPVANQEMIYTLHLVFDDNHAEKMFKGGLTLIR